VQHTRDGMTQFMRALATSYVLYFNQKYRRVGTLFQGAYKACWVGEGDTGDRYLLHLSRYIHLNPRLELQRSDLLSWPYSSYPYFISPKRAEWVDPQPILAYFSQFRGATSGSVLERYQTFVETGKEDPRDIVPHLIID